MLLSSKSDFLANEIHKALKIYRDHIITNEVITIL